MNTRELEMIALSWVLLLALFCSGFCWTLITRHVTGHMRVMAVACSGTTLTLSILLFSYLLQL